MREWGRNVDETWEDFRVELLRVEPAPDGRVVVELHVARNDSFSDARDAFAAAGVPH